MFELTKIITAMAMPPFHSIILFILAFILSVLNYKKLSKLSAVLGLLLLYIFSTPYLSRILNDNLVEESHLTLDDYKQAQAIVILSGGIRDSKELYSKLAVAQMPLERMRYGAYLHRETDLPILVTGSAPNGTSEAGVMAKEFAQFFNTPVKWIEPKAKTTKENALYSKTLLEPEGIKKIILVTNQWHMKRAKMLFEQQGFEVLPANIGAGITPASYGGYMYFIPQAGAMVSSSLALKEWLGYWKEKK